MGPVMPPRATFLQENSFYQISINQKFGKAWLDTNVAWTKWLREFI